MVTWTVPGSRKQIMARKLPPVVHILASALLGWHLTFLVLHAPQFQHILNDSSRTSKAYEGHAGHELSLLSGRRRGMILKELCKTELIRLHPHSKIEEPTRGTRCNGARRSASQAEYDFSMDGRKVRCKSTQMSWDRTNRVWHARTEGVKLPWPGFRDQAPFDDLYLIMFSPDSLHIIKHDLQTGVASDGNVTGSRGHKIVIRGASGQECWQTARSQILYKFLAAGQCKLVDRIDLSDVKVSSWLGKQMEQMTMRQDCAYKGVPLNRMAPQRGLRIEELALEVDRILHPDCSFSRVSSNIDWVRGEVKVEVKHGQMLFQRGNKKWQCRFSNIKCAGAGARDEDLFDELWLAIYSPFGIHFLQHPGGKACFWLNGLKEQDVGRFRDVRASHNVLDIREALDEMLKTMVDEWGCQPLARIVW